MDRFNDPTFLKTEQYKNSSNLGARVALHQRFSTNPYGWPRWSFEALAPHLRGRVLEVGGGPGWLWREHGGNLPPGVRVCFSDLSPGMLQEARAGLAGAGIDFIDLDAQDLPFETGVFQAVVANHMLYHVPDLPRAARALARVLAPGGVLFAATNGRAHLHELTDLAREFEPRYAANMSDFLEGFCLENAIELLGPAFDRVSVERYPDGLWVTEARPLADYIASMSSASDNIRPEQLPDLEAFFQARIDRDGGVRITKDAGYALAFKA